LQILNYPKNIDIYDKNTVLALKKIKKHNILNNADCQILIDSYLQLRKWEHLIQISEELQTHIIPVDEAYLNNFIMRAGYTSVSAFFNHYNNVTDEVHKIFNNILLTNTENRKFFIDEEFTINDYMLLLKNLISPTQRNAPKYCC